MSSSIWGRERKQNPEILPDKSKCADRSKVAGLRYYCTKDKGHDDKHFAKFKRLYHFRGNGYEEEPITKEIELFAFWENKPVDQEERPIYHER